MTAKANHSTPATTCSTPLVLFGIDSRGKPKAARFRKEHAGLAVRAASQLALQVVAGNDPKVAEIAARLPVGRVHATGRAFVPFIRRDLYEQLVAAAANGNTHPTSPPNGPSGDSGSTPGGSAPHLPSNWQAIGLGDLVVANQSQEDGWYEAIVVEQSGDMFTLRWLTIHESAGLCVIGSGLACYPRRPSRPQRMESQPSPLGTQSMSNRSPVTKPAVRCCQKIGMRSTSIISCWPKTTASGGRFGRPFRSRKPVTSSSCAGARNMRPTSG